MFLAIVNGDRDYFKNLFADIDNQDIQAAFLFDMLNLDITGFHAGNIPETSGLKAQRLHSLDSVGKWLVNSLHGGFFVSPRLVNDWQPTISGQDLYSSYLFFCSQHRLNQYEIKGNPITSKELKAIGFNNKRITQGVIWDLGDLLEARKKVSDYYKIEPIED